MNSKEIREAFLSFFEERHHTRVQSASLNVTDDPTLLFPNAGMTQFKSCFLGVEKREYVRACSSQKCMRISGKHNDFENVGVTPRHHTFFEMLGNFSFGDYFKKDAIEFSWTFLLEEMKLPKDRLWVTIFEDDDEAEELWKEHTTVPHERIVRLGEADNFWAMGDTGPCGPCSEIHYCLLDDPSQATAKGLAEDDGSFIEIWNLVFMQFNRSENGELAPLPKPSIDTGMGLERITAVKQGLSSTYDTDLLRGVIGLCEELTGHTYDGTSYEVKDLRTDLSYARDVAMRVIADHSRAIAFLIADGIHPSSDGRGYVLRRILRRAVRHGRVLEFKEPFLKKTTAKIVEMLGDVYPELREQAEAIAQVSEAEEVRFYETLDGGLALLKKEVESHSGSTVFSGKTAFQLYDTYGFPIDLTEDALKAYGMTVDREVYDRELEQQRDRSRSERASKKLSFQTLEYSGDPTTFIGYRELSSQQELLHLEAEERTKDVLTAGDLVRLVFAETPFYAESGGQVGDRGSIELPGVSLEVCDVQKTPAGHIVHTARVSAGELTSESIGQGAALQVDEELRKATARNHSATHLVHAALQEVLGDHVKQAGSRVDENSLRFDYSHFRGVSPEELRDISQFVNEEIRRNYEAKTEVMKLDEAKSRGAMALFGEKYGDEVRVVEIGPNSLELCGGTHVQRSGDIGFLALSTEGGISAGVRRIECVTGATFEQLYLEQSEELSALMHLLKGERRDLGSKVERLLARLKETEAELEAAKSQVAQASTGSFIAKKKESSSGVSFIAESVAELDAEGLKRMVDKLRVELGSGVVALGSTAGGKTTVVAGVTKDLAGKIHAGKLIQEAVKESGGKGGGRPDFAQAGGLTPPALPVTLAAISRLLEEAQ
ncbi:alanine--tRNA ligase [bacterium]|nr:alanine--tRNA ligase [bacterium]